MDDLIFFVQRTMNNIREDYLLIDRIIILGLMKE
jgi:hypothetical protein